MFEIYQSPKNKNFYFRLKAKNGLVILASEGYKTKQSCKAGIRSVKKNAGSQQFFHLKKAKNGKVYFSLNARNGGIIGSRQMYASAAGRKKGIESVQRNADSEVIDLT